MTAFNRPSAFSIAAVIRPVRRVGEAAGLLVGLSGVRLRVPRKRKPATDAFSPGPGRRRPRNPSHSAASSGLSERYQVAYSANSGPSSRTLPKCFSWKARSARLQSEANDRQRLVAEGNRAPGDRSRRRVPFAVGGVGLRAADERHVEPVRAETEVVPDQIHRVPNELVNQVIRREFSGTG